MTDYLMLGFYIMTSLIVFVALIIIFIKGCISIKQRFRYLKIIAFLFITFLLIPRTNASLEFNGKDDVLIVGDETASDNLNKLTISFCYFVNGRPETGKGHIWDKSKGANDGMSGYGRYLVEHFYLDDTIYGAPDYLDVWVFARITYNHDDDCLWGQWISENETVAYKKWHNLAITYDGTSIDNDPKFYIDGKLIKVIEMAKPRCDKQDDDSSYNMRIGNRDDLMRGFNGRIKDFAIWDTILNEQEIASLSKNVYAPLFVKRNNLIIYLPLDDNGNLSSAVGQQLKELSYKHLKVTGYGSGLKWK